MTASDLASHSTSATSGVAAHDFRKAVSRFATGITVITSVDDSGVRGMTCNSFTSVSLDPPTILVSLKPGKTHSAISEGGIFGVSVLRDEHQHYSAYFSGPPKAEAPPDFVVRNSVPTLRECLAWFECEVIGKVDVHDHALFIARVTGCGTTDGAPIMFFESRYHRFAPPPANRLPERQTVGAAA
jgi:flavin reductase (DIM6/NTAB) family NADH-FMN oxidoreductase RutF